MTIVAGGTADTLALDGGAPARDKPWPDWPGNTEVEWRERVEPALREVYLSDVEGLPCPRALEFGEAFAQACGARYGALLPHGTDALAAALIAALDLDGFTDGGEILLPNYTFVATASAALDAGYRVVYADIDPATYTLCPRAAEAALRPGETTALLPVHLAGHPADMEALNALARRHGLKVIEDAAQAHGATTTAGPVGSLADAGAFSFQSTKNLTSGEGGAVTTNDQDLLHRVMAFSNVGRVPGGARWEYPRLGWNYRPSEYIAALLLTRLPKLEEQATRRAKNAATLSRLLEQVGGLTPPALAPWVTRHGYHLYICRYHAEAFGGRSRGDFLRALSAEGVPCSPGYGQPLSEEEGMRRLRERHPHLVRVEPCPNVEAACQETVWLYQYELLGDASDMADIAEAVAKIRKAFSR